jgi:hypothetical protein
MLRNQNTQPLPFNDRLFFTINEEEDGDVFPHGVVMAPADITEAEARARIDRAYRRAVERHPETWNWDDVIDQLEADDFRHIQAGHWVEKG